MLHGTLDTGIIADLVGIAAGFPFLLRSIHGRLEVAQCTGAGFNGGWLLAMRLQAEILGRY
jgi:hypothetical protein